MKIFFLLGMSLMNMILIQKCWLLFRNTSLDYSDIDQYKLSVENIKLTL